MHSIYRPDLLYKAGKFHSNTEFSVSKSGDFSSINDADIAGAKIVAWTGKAVIPGFVNVHSLLPEVDSGKVGIESYQRQRLLVLARNHVPRRRTAHAARGLRRSPDGLS